MLNSAEATIRVHAKCCNINPIALRTAKTLWSFDHSECNWVKILDEWMACNFASFFNSILSNRQEGQYADN